VVRRKFELPKLSGLIALVEQCVHTNPLSSEVSAGRREDKIFQDLNILNKLFQFPELPPNFGEIAAQV